MPYELLEEDVPEEGFVSSSIRNISRQASNLGTRSVGLPGDILSLVNEYIAGPISEKITGNEALPYEKTLLGKALPTTESHRRGLEEFSGEYLKPRNKVEQFFDDLIEDAAILFVPGGKISKIGKSASKRAVSSLAKSGVANAASEVARQTSGSEGAATGAKLASLFALSLIDKPAAAKLVGNLYTQAEAHLPEEASISAKRLSSNLDSLEKKITSSRPRSNLAPSEKFVVDEIDKIRSLVKDGRANVKQLWAQKRSLNEELSGKRLFEIDKKGQQRARSHAKSISHYLRDSIEDYGKSNPEFYKPFKNADEAFGTLAQSRWISSWIDKNIKHSPATAGLLHFIGGTAATLGGALSPLYAAGKLGYRVSKSPTLRKMYANTLKAAAKEDVVAFNKELSKFDEALQEEESNDRYEFVD